MWQHLASGLPSSLVLLLSIWCRTGPPEPSVTSVTSIGPGGCSADCSCPRCPENTCEAQKLVAAGALSSLQWWWNLIVISLFLNFVLAGFIWVSLPYICAGVWNGRKEAEALKGEDQVKGAAAVRALQTEVEATERSCVISKGGPVTPAVFAGRRRSAGK